MSKIFTIIFGLLVSTKCLGQQPNIFKFEEYMALVKKYHPIAKQSNIGIAKAEAEILQAKGAFDPYINTYIGKKVFLENNYYQDFSPEIKIPTWLGLDLYAGLENLTGNKIDPTATKGKSSYLGLNIPLVKNLLLDKRRATLQQARIFNTLANAEQKLILNDLTFNAVVSYLNWLKAYQSYETVSQNLAVNQKRFEFVKKSLANGERAAIDTTEALTQLQSFQVAQAEKLLEFQNAGLDLSTYLWNENNANMLLTNGIEPENIWTAGENAFNITQLQTELQSHPSLGIYDNKLKILQIDKKLKFQEMLPKVDFRYNFLNPNYQIQNALFEANFLKNNYQYGLKFEMPLFFRQGKAVYNLAKLKIQDTQLELRQKQIALQVKLNSYFNEYETFKKQTTLQQATYSNFQKLLIAEEKMFSNGESSLFMINSRENKLQEAQQKLIETQYKFCKSGFALRWAVAGL